MTHVWLVVVIHQDGTDGNVPPEKYQRYRFAEYRDAHAFWKSVEKLRGTPFFPTAEPPQRLRLVQPKVYRPGEFPPGWSRPT